MTHSTITRTDLPWNKPGSLGFSISQRHMDLSRMTCPPLIQERVGRLKTAFRRHGEFAGRALARTAGHPFPDSRSIRDSRSGEFVYLARQFGRRGSAGATSPGMHEQPIMRYPGGAVVTSPGASGLEKTEVPHIGAPTSGLISGAAADYVEQMGIAGTHTAQAQQMSAVQQILMPRRSTHEESSLNDPRHSRSQDDSASLSGSPRTAFTSTDETLVGNDGPWKQGHEPTTAETVLSTALSSVSESIGIPAALTRAPVMSGTADPGNAALQGSSGSMPRLASPSVAPVTSVASVMRRLPADTEPDRQLPLTASYRIPGISRNSRMVARQTGGFEAARIMNANRPAGVHIGIHAGRHVNPELVKPQGSLSYHRQPLLQASRTRAEACTETDATIVGRPLEGDVTVIRNTGRQPGSANAGHASSYARSTVLARQSIPNASVSHETHESHESQESHEASNRDGNDKSIISRAAISEDAEAPDSLATLDRPDSASDSTILPAVLVASSSIAVQLQTAASRLPRDVGFTDAHHIGTSFPLQSQPGSLALRAGSVDARSGMMRSLTMKPVADRMAKGQGNRRGNLTRGNSPTVRLSPGTMLHAVDRMNRAGKVDGTVPAIAGGGGKGGHFLARMPRPTGDVRSASMMSGISETGPQPYLDSFSVAESRLLSGGILGREPMLAGFQHPVREHSRTAGELQTRDATLRRGAIASPATISESSLSAISASQAPVAGAGELQPAALPSSHGYWDVMQRRPGSTSAGSLALSPASRAFTLQADPWRTGGGVTGTLRRASFDEGKPASSSRAVSSRTGAFERPLVLAHRAPQVQAQRAEAGMGEGKAAWDRIMRLTDDASGGAIHAFPLARQEAPEDRYGLVPAPHSVAGGVPGAPGSEVAGVESSIGKPDADEMAEQTWRLISERLVIEQERRGLAAWSR